MHQIKIFKGLENDISALEAEVNRWLYDCKAKVVQVFGNIAPQSTSTGVESLAAERLPPSDVMLVVVYEEPL